MASAPRQTIHASAPTSGVSSLNDAVAPIPRTFVDYLRSFGPGIVIVLVCLVTPLVWTIPGMPDFVTLTLASNSAQVVLLPLIAGGLWWITASRRFIGETYRTRWWENIVMAFLFALALWGAWNSAHSIGALLRAI